MKLVSVTRACVVCMLFTICALFPSTARADNPSGTNLGTFSLLVSSANQGNSLGILYGKSTEGAQLTTYWAGTPVFQVITAGQNYELVENQGGRCLTLSGTVASLTTCTGATTQLLNLNAQTDGSYTIQAVLGQCLSDTNSFTTATAQACDSSTGERWNFTGTKALVLSSTAASTASSTTTTATTTTAAATTTAVAATTAAATTTATASTTSLGTFSLLTESASQGNALGILYGKSTEGASLLTYWAGSPSFQVLSVGNAKYEIAETSAGRCLTAAASALTLQTCAGGASQLFTLTAQADGSYVVQSGLGSCLYAPGAFATATVATCNTAAGEKWKFTGSTVLALGTSSTTTTTAAATSTGIVNSPTVPSGYKLTFDDEFTTLNISDTNGSGAKWYTHTIQCCMSDTSNPLTPTFMAGIGDGTGKNPYSLVSGGGLDIRLQKTNGAWYSGVISTVDNTGTGFSQKYGYFEMKAKFPNAVGTWPAFWLLNANHLSQNAPAGEIDVVESYMFTPNVANTTLHDWSTSTQVGYKWSQVSDLSVGFHTFGMLWTASRMTFYVDNVIVYDLATPSIMQQPYFPIIDLGLGGGFPTLLTPQSSDMIVQYMRVYQAP